MAPQYSRRRVLATAATAGAGVGLDRLASTLPRGSGAETDDGSPAVPTTPEEIRAAFDDVPRLRKPGLVPDPDPAPRDRWLAKHTYPGVVVPDEGAIPDPHYGRVTVTLEAPPWVLASVYDRLKDVDDPTWSAVRDHLLELRPAYEEWVTPDGRDAADAVLDALREDG